MVQPMVRPRTSRQLWDGVKMIGPNVGTRDGWPVGDGCQARRGNDAFTVLLKQARVDGLAVSRERWVEALQQSYPGVTKRRAVWSGWTAPLPMSTDMALSWFTCGRGGGAQDGRREQSARQKAGGRRGGSGGGGAEA